MFYDQHSSGCMSIAFLVLSTQTREGRGQRAAGDSEHPQILTFATFNNIYPPYRKRHCCQIFGVLFDAPPVRCALRHATPFNHRISLAFRPLVLSG